MTEQKKPITAGELIKQLEKDAAYQEMARQREIATKLRQEQFSLEERPIVEALAAQGVIVTSISKIYLLPEQEKAIPVLLEHLQMPYSDCVRGAIAHALAIKKAKGLFGPLKTAFEKEQSKSVKEFLANALYNAATPKNMPEIIELVSNPIHGEARIILLGLLKRSRRPDAKKALQDLKEDSQLVYQIELYEV